MDLNTLSILNCPSCRVNYEVNIHKSDNNCLVDGLLICPECQTSVPVVAGFPLFNEARPYFENSVTEWFALLKEHFYDLGKEYEQFLKAKASRNTTDLYAAFQPFNESTRAIYPFIKLLKENLEPGDVILDTWCRTGWSGELLAGLFPDNRIISIWEGNNNVLGYKGFAYWLGYPKRAPNLDVIFTHPDNPLPFKSNTIAMVHGLDSLHRYRQGGFIPECFRVCKDDGVLIFPHIHLNNAQPSPFFDRGCHQYHGKEWKEWLDRLLVNTQRAAWVIPEPKLFDVPENYKLKDESNTGHYNALILIADRKYENKLIEAVNYPDIRSDTRLVVNPLLDINLHQCRVRPCIEQEDALFTDLFVRHPCYAERIKTVTGNDLSKEQARFIWFALSGNTLEEIAGSMGITTYQAISIAQALSLREITHPANVTDSQVSLQNFYALATLKNLHRAESFTQLWDTAMESYGDTAMLHWLEDGSELTADEVLFLVDAIRCRFEQMTIKPGMRILIISNHHPEALLVCWAAWLSGIVTVIADYDSSIDKIDNICSDYHIKLVFTDKPAIKESLDELCMVFDNDNSDDFSLWLEPAMEQSLQWQCADPQADALILFTSGSTGDPKGVVFSQQAICSSACNMASTFNWNKEVLLSLGPLSMMSGLRNPALAALVSASKILVPAGNAAQVPVITWEQANKQHVSVITAVPFWFKCLLQAESRLSPPEQLKQILLTGTVLEPELYQKSKLFQGISIGNYYGLTETGGICSATLSSQDKGTLGYPVGALIHIVDQDGQIVDIEETGELYVLTGQSMSRYFNAPEETDKIKYQAYIKTGDLAQWDSQGRLVLKGRIDNRLKLRNGQIILTDEVEAMLYSIDGVDSAAIGIVDDKLIALLNTQRELEEIEQSVLSLAENIRFDKMFKVKSLPVNNHGKLVRPMVSDLIKQMIQS